jgi:hypothetical protein
MHAMCVTTELELPALCFPNVQQTETKSRLSLGMMTSGTTLLM